MSFGFALPYLTSCLNGVIVKDKYGGAAVGLFAAITPTVSGLSALPFSLLAQRLGTKVPFMALACVSSATVAALGMALGVDELGSAGVLLCLYVLEGWLRCVFEGINKAVFADLFLGQSEVAFATLIVQSGGASALAFWMMSVRVDERVVAGCSCLGRPGNAHVPLRAENGRRPRAPLCRARQRGRGALDDDRLQRAAGRSEEGRTDAFGAYYPPPPLSPPPPQVFNSAGRFEN